MHFTPLLALALSTSGALASHSEFAKSPMHRRGHKADVEARAIDGKHQWKRAMGPTWTKASTLATSKHSTGVAAMQLTVTGVNTALIIDKVERNPLSIKGSNQIDRGKTHPAWVQWLNFNTGANYPLDSETNSFCAGGSWLSNGTMVSVGGNPAISKSSYYDANGITAIRIFPKCDDTGCEIQEWPSTVRLSSSRWYPGTIRLQDGSIMVLGGMTEGGFNNDNRTDNPTLEYFPSKSLNNGMPIHSNFLHNALNSNLFPIMYLLPNGNVFVAANTRAMIYNWASNKEQELPNLPNGVRCTYPWTAASVMLPLTIANKWTPEVLLCGGSTISDTISAYSMSSQTPASKQCSRILLTSAGIKAGWATESLPEARVMGEAVLTPDGKVIIVNGAGTGMAGYGNVHNTIGQSNADHPDYRGLVYDPLLPKGKRISTAMPTSKVERLYHSVATLTASGEILISGSNPNADVSKVTYKTEYVVEFLSPPYMTMKRPTFTWAPTNVLYGHSFKLMISPPAGTTNAQISIVLMDFGYHTHSVGVDQRLVELTWSNYTPSNGQITVKAPSKATYFPPGYGWLAVVCNGVPSVFQKVMVGDGSSPPWDKAATANMLKQTAATHGAAV